MVRGESAPRRRPPTAAAHLALLTLLALIVAFTSLACTAGERRGDDSSGATAAPPPRNDSRQRRDSLAFALSREAGQGARLHSALFHWMEDGDSGRLLTPAEADTANVVATLRLYVDTAGTLRRYDYSPVSHSGDWVDDLTFIIGRQGRIARVHRRAATTATACGAVVRVEEELAASGATLVPVRRLVLGADDRPLADSTCAESLPPLGSLPTALDSLAPKGLLPRNWRSLASQAGATR